MRIDREGFKRAVDEDVLGNNTLKNLWENGDTEQAEEYAQSIFLISQNISLIWKKSVKFLALIAGFPLKNSCNSFLAIKMSLNQRIIFWNPNGKNSLR